MTGETVSQEALEFLDTVGADAADQFLAFVTGHRTEADALDAERVNMLGAVAWAHRQERWSTVVVFATQLVSFLRRRGHWTDRAAMLSVAVEAARALGNPGDLAAAYADLATTHWLQGRWADADPLIGEALRVAEQAGDAAAAGRLRGNLGTLCADRGDLGRAIKLLERTRRADGRAGPHRAAPGADELGNDLCRRRSDRRRTTSPPLGGGSGRPTQRPVGPGERAWGPRNVAPPARGVR